MSSATSTANLIRRFASGHRRVFKDLYRRVAPSLYLWGAMRLPASLHHRLDPEDLVQEVWFRALLKIDTFDSTRGTFRAWIFGIANRTFAEQLRRISVRRRNAASPSPHTLDEIPASVTSVTQRVARNEEVHRLLTYIQGLDAESQKILTYRGLEGLPHAEVGRRLGISAEACEIRWRRLRGRLRTECLPEGLFCDRD